MAPDELAHFLSERLAERPYRRSEAPGARRAAVLVPLLFRGGEPYVLFTQRSLEVPTHKGHISFPGGGIEPGDADECAAALRETQEEIGIAPAEVRLLGRMDDHATNSRDFVISPFAGIVPDGVARITSDREVARILETPLEYLLEAGHREPDQRTGHWQYRWRDVIIWGATARILSSLLHIMGLTNPLAEDALNLKARQIEPR